MSDFIITPSVLSGKVRIPSSKSQTLRAVLFGSLAKGCSVIKYPLASPDTRSMIEALRSFGIRVEEFENEIRIEGSNGIFETADDVINAGNSGIVFRFVSALAALSAHPIVITGDVSLRYQRPIEPLLLALRQLGVRAVSTKGDGFAPVVIEGPIKLGKAEIAGEDSQPVSGLLIASAFAKGSGIELHVKNPGETPFVQMTLDWFERLGLSYCNHNFNRYQVAGEQSIKGFSYDVPGDFSTAAFPIVAALITRSEITIENLDFRDSQGDKKLIEYLQKMGAAIEIDPEKKEVRVRKSPLLKGIRIDMNEIIDALPALSVLGCFSDGEMILTNASVARTKECDRIRAIATELRKLGADIEEKEDGLVIRRSVLKGCCDLVSYRDHRMAMALSIAAMAAEGKSCVGGVECIEKTYPGFLDHFRQLGASIEEAVCV